MHKLSQAITIGELAQGLGLESWGNKQRKIWDVCELTSAQTTSLCFNNKEIPITSPAVVIGQPGTENDVEEGLFSAQPRLDFIRSLEYLDKAIGFSKAKEKAKVHPTAVIGENVVLGKGVIVGENTTIEPNVVIMNNCRIGRDSLIRANTTIGSDGFGFERSADGTPIKFVHLGGVVIGDNVEIGANTCIARGTLNNTVIEDRVKIDNLVHIAHNCRIRKGAFVIAGAEISGGVDIGENAWIAPNACTMQKVKIGKNAIVGLGAVVTKNVADDSIVMGNPAKART